MVAPERSVAPVPSEAHLGLGVFGAGETVEPVPHTFRLLPPELRRTVDFERLELEPTSGTDSVPLFATIDFDKPELKVGFAVLDALSTSSLRVGLCEVGSDGSYNRYRGGYPLGKHNYQMHHPAGVIIRIGDYALADRV